MKFSVNGVEYENFAAAVAAAQEQLKSDPKNRVNVMLGEEVVAKLVESGSLLIKEPWVGKVL